MKRRKISLWIAGFLAACIVMNINSENVNAALETQPGQQENGNTGEEADNTTGEGEGSGAHDAAGGEGGNGGDNAAGEGEGSGAHDAAGGEEGNGTDNAAGEGGVSGGDNAAGEGGVSGADNATGEGGVSGADNVAGEGEEGNKTDNTEEKEEGNGADDAAGGEEEDGSGKDDTGEEGDGENGSDTENDTDDDGRKEETDGEEEKEPGQETGGLTVSGNGLTPDAFSDGDTEELEEQTEPIVALEVPDNLDFVVDPWNLSGRGQIYSEPFTIRNYGSAACILYLKDMVCSPGKEGDVVIVEDAAQLYMEGTANIYMEMNFDNGDVRILSQNKQEYAVFLEPESELVFWLTGKVNEKTTENWENKQIRVSLKYFWTVPLEDGQEDVR